MADQHPPPPPDDPAAAPAEQEGLSPSAMLRPAGNEVVVVPSDGFTVRRDGRVVATVQRDRGLGLDLLQHHPPDALPPAPSSPDPRLPLRWRHRPRELCRELGDGVMEAAYRGG